MNCKPGDLAVIVNGIDDGWPHVGKIIRVTVQSPRTLGAWYYEGVRLKKRNGVLIEAIEDIALRPIRPDETPDESIEAMKNLMSTKEKYHAQRETQRNA